MNIKKAVASLIVFVVLAGVVMIVDAFNENPKSERKKLEETVLSILKKEYGHLSLTVEVKEDSYMDYGGEDTNRFKSKLISRVSQNHFNLNITLQTSEQSSEAYMEIFSGMAELLESQLPIKTPNLMLIMKVNDKIPGKGPVFLDTKILFPTVP
jgi:hypothetical protein